MKVPKSKVQIYRIHVPNEKGVYNSITAPPGFQCSNRTKLDHSLADPGGWRYLYNGYQTSVDVYFTCQDARYVFDLVKKIKYEIALNRLHDHVGFHVIGWVLHRWYCLAPTTPYTTMYVFFIISEQISITFIYHNAILSMHLTPHMPLAVFHLHVNALLSIV